MIYIFTLIKGGLILECIIIFCRGRLETKKVGCRGGRGPGGTLKGETTSGLRSEGVKNHNDEQLLTNYRISKEKEVC